MKALDLFCASGPASAGYFAAGFDQVVGVDCRPQKNYPFNFVRGDAIEFLKSAGHGFDFIHASPPCQHWSRAVKVKDRDNHPNLIPELRAALIASGKPWVIENVPGAVDELIDPVTLCGSAFGLPIRRHRLFESNFPIAAVECSHDGYPRLYPPSINRTTPLRVLSLSGGFTKTDVHDGAHRRAMGVRWRVTMPELSLSIPPVYTEYIGRCFLFEQHSGQGPPGELLHGAAAVYLSPEKGILEIGPILDPKGDEMPKRFCGCIGDDLPKKKWRRLYIREQAKGKKTWVTIGYFCKRCKTVMVG